jgi:tetratricopeptide (TPR) repeat protein
LGLSSFSEETRAFFFGRDDETAELGRRVQRKLLTVLFGQSGLGKTSMLRAGLVPRLRPEGYCPIYVRIDYSSGSPAPGEQIKEAVRDATEGAGTWSKPGTARTGESLWEFFHHRDDVLADASGRVLTPLLIFDQFEEVFTLAQTDDTGRARARAFLGELANLVENRAPSAIEDDEASAERFDFSRADYRVLIALREDYLAHLEGLRDLMPSVTQNRVRLTRMTGGPALEAVIRPGAGLVSDEVARQIVRFVSGASDLATAEVEPSLLSLVCRELNEVRIAKGEPEISADLLAGSRESILGEFYERSLADQPAGVRHFIEDVLLTDSGYRESVAEERVCKAFAGAGAPNAATQLVDRRLLRIEERLDVRRVELTHDVLCGVVRASRDSRREREAKERAERELAATRAKEESTRQALRRARTVAASCAVLALVAVGSAIFGYLNLQKAHARHTRELADTARAQAEGLVSYMMQDLAPSLEQYGRVALLTKLSDQAVHYFDELPPELKGPASLSNGAEALALASHIKSLSGDKAGSDQAQARSIATWEQAVAAAPGDSRPALGLALEKFVVGTDERLSSSEQEKRQREAIDELRHLHQNHPEDREITRQLASCLTGFGFQVGYAWGHAAEEVAVAEEALGLLDGLLATDPKSPILLASRISALQARADGTQFIGNKSKAIEYSEAALAFAEKALQSDPGNLALIAAAAHCGNNLSYRTSEVNDERSLEGERIARAHWQTLSQLDPNNAEYRKQFVWSHLMESNYWIKTGRLAPMRHAYEEFDTLLESVDRDREANEVFAWNTARLAKLEADTGHPERARERLAEMRDRYRTWVAKLPPADAAGWVAQAEPLGSASDVFISLHDWPELEHIATQTFAVLDDAVRQDPKNLPARLYRIGSRSWIALVRVRTGHAAEAVALLEPLPAQIVAVPTEPGDVEFRQTVTDGVANLLGEALLETGAVARAHSVLEGCLRSRETAVARQPINWGYQAGLAETCTLLARTFDSAKPEEAARRKKLLDCAAAILAKGETEGQLTIDNKELQAKVAALRGAEESTAGNAKRTENKP